MKKIIITGGTGGIGKQLAPLLGDKYEVISCGSKELDVTNLSDVESFFNKHADCEILIHLAGVSHNNMIHKYSQDRENLDKQINTNIGGLLNTITACLPNMRKNEFGRIILMSSVVANKPVMGAGIYGACKSFMDGIAQSVALENASKNITCNSIQLGYFDAGLLYTVPEPIRESIKSTIPLKRWGKVEELHKLIELLIETDYITGTNQKINGGLDFG